ncbi:hypothetical protein ACFL5Y_02465 [Candidatus Omnitrophota bacterium]
MKVIILAADSCCFDEKQQNPLPRCLLRIKNISVLEGQLRTLHYCGYALDDIWVVIGSQGAWFSGDIVERIKRIHPNIIINPTNRESGSCHSLYLALEKIGLGEDIVVIDGDLIFKKKMIDLIRPGKNVMLTRPILGLNENGGYVVVENDQVISTSIRTLPANVSISSCYLHSGIIAFEAGALPVLLEKLKENMQSDLLCAVASICSTIPIINVDYMNANDRNTGTNERGAELVGGSYAKLRKQVIVRKEARGKGVKKLRNEIVWLKNLDEEIKPYFPKVLKVHNKPDYVWFEMPYYDLPNLRELIMLGELKGEKTLFFLENILDFMFAKIYPKILCKAPRDWVRKKYLNRINLRLVDCMRVSPVLNKFIKAKRIILNGQDLRNLPDVVKDIAMRPKLIEALNPKYLRMVHGDLHFQNILIDTRKNKEMFLLMDPRGEIDGSDFYYDIGKLWHSFHGLYDFLHTDQAQLNWEEKGNDIKAELTLENTGALAAYKQLNHSLSHLLQKYELIHGDELWQMKTLFAEMVHFGSLIPFHIQNDGKDQRSVSMYVTAVKLANDFVESLDLERWPEDNSYANINTLEDYQKLLQNHDIGIRDAFDSIGDLIEA